MDRNVECVRAVDDFEMARELGDRLEEVGGFRWSEVAQARDDAAWAHENVPWEERLEVYQRHGEGCEMEDLLRDWEGGEVEFGSGGGGHGCWW